MSFTVPPPSLNQRSQRSSSSYTHADPLVAIVTRYPPVQKPDYSEAKIVVAMVRPRVQNRRDRTLSAARADDADPQTRPNLQVGLPARGKSFLSNKLMRYLQWLEYKVKVFNVGQLRRRKARNEHPEYAHVSFQSEPLYRAPSGSSRFLVALLVASITPRPTLTTRTRAQRLSERGLPRRAWTA